MSAAVTFDCLRRTPLERSTLTLRADLDLGLGPTVHLQSGVGFKYADALAYDVSLDGGIRVDASGEPSPLVLDTSFTALATAAYLQVGVHLTDALRVEIGMRGD